MKKSKILRRVLGTVLAIALAGASVPVSALEIEMPDEPMSVESNDGTRYLATTAQRASSEIPLILGINVVGGNLFNGAVVMAGTGINDNPDPYIWNYNYLYPDTDIGGGQLSSNNRRSGTENFDQSQYYEHGISSGTSSGGMANGNGLYSSGGANQVMSGALEELGGVSYGVYHMIDVWIGFNSDVLDQIDYVKNEMDPNSKYYNEGYADYNPLITDVSTGTVTARAYAWAEMGEALSDYLKKHQELSTRYGDPKALCYNIQEYAFGIPYYIDSLIASGKIEKITGACIKATSSDGLTFSAVDPTTLDDVKAGAYAVGNTVNWLQGDFTMSQLKEKGADVIVIYTAGYGDSVGGGNAGGNGGTGNAGGGNASGGETLTRAYLEGLMEDVGFTAETAPVIIDAANESVTAGSNGYNYAPTTPLYVPYIAAYMYMEQLEDLASKGDKVAAAINPTALFEYTCDEFFHIKDDSAYTIAEYWIGDKWDKTDSELDKVPVVAESEFVYDKDSITKAIKEGIQFALNNQNNSSFYLQGACRKGEPAYVLAQMVKESGVNSFADILKAADGDYSNITYAYENNQEESTLDITSLVQFYGEEGLAKLIDNYAEHMDRHAWKPDTSVAGTYGYGMSGTAAETNPNTQTTVSGFTDVAAGSFYADAVTWAVDRAITNGISAAAFGPNAVCSRAEIVTFLYRAAGEPAVSADTKNPFTDVNENDYFYNAVLWAVSNGITSGTSDTLFSPHASCSRAQAVTFLYRYADEPAVSSQTSFTDVSSGSFYADAVAWAVSQGITNGSSAATFGSADPCYRSHIVTFLYRGFA